MSKSKTEGDSSSYPVIRNGQLVRKKHIAHAEDSVIEPRFAAARFKDSIFLNSGRAIAG